MDPMRSVVCLVLVAGCAHGTLTCPARGGSAWSELRSPHFLLHTDLPTGEAGAALGEFEQTYRAFEALLFPSTAPPRDRIEVVLFSREEDFRELAPAGASGYFLPHQNDDVETSPTIAMFGRLQPGTRRRFQHELTHRFLEQRIRRAPPWLEEGLAEFYSTMRLTDGEAVLGELPLNKVFTTEIRTFIGLTERWVEHRVGLGDLPRLGELLALDGRAFHDPDRELANYATSWALVHLLQNGDDGDRARFARLLDGLAAGAEPAAAWRRAFGDVPTDALSRRLTRYVLHREVPVRRVPFPAPDPPPVEAVRPLDDAAVHLLWARIRPWDRRENIYRAGDDLGEALSRAPSSTEARYWNALYLMRWRRFDEADAELRAALMLAPRDARLWHALAALRWARAVEEPRRLPEAEEAVARLAPLARTPRALDFVARFMAARGDRAGALPFARRAVEAGPGCWECRDTLVQIRRESGWLDELLLSLAKSPG